MESCCASECCHLPFAVRSPGRVYVVSAVQAGVWVSESYAFCGFMMVWDIVGMCSVQMTESTFKVKMVDFSVCECVCTLSDIFQSFWSE